MKGIKFILWMALALFATTSHAQFSVIRGVNPSQAFVNLNADSSGNIAVNCVVGCGASAGTGGLAPNGSPVSGNPVLVAGSDGTNARTIATDTSGILKTTVTGVATVGGSVSEGSVTSAFPLRIAGWDGTNIRTLKTDSSGQANINVVNTPAVTVSGTPNVAITNTPAVTLTSTTLSGSSNNVLISPSTNTLVDHSGTITTGGTAQTLSAAKSRKYFFFQNLSVSNMYLNFTSAASASTGSILVVPGGSFVQEGSFVSSELISVFGVTTGQAFTSKDF